ncbi:MAG: hypothetical protein LBM77_12180, partial [Spirochaetaceae bacterium]|nr:hypothetical protein [Spirochaetaceae bacterium]
MNSLNPLLARFPGLAEKITTSQDDALDLQLEKAASGDWTLKANNLYVHSARDPRKEAERLVNSLDEAGAYIVLGFGLGYAALSLVQKINREPRRPRERLLPFIIIVEKHLSILKRALDLIDLNAVLEYPNLIIIPAAEPSAIVHALDAVNGKDCSRGSRRSRLIPNPTLSKLDAQYYTSIENIIAAYQSKDAVNEATLKKFGALWERNSRKNKAII